MAYAETDGAKTANPASKDEDFLSTMRTEYRHDSQAMEQNHREMLDDLRFFAGDQWDEGVRKQRELANRPCLTTDHLAQHVRQVTGDIRLNKPSIKVRPVDSGADPDTAELFTGLIRNIEQQSMAHVAYTRAGGNAAICGEGAFKIITQYSEDDGFDQDIRLAPLYNPMAVIWDRNARMPTMEDANHCWVLERYSMEAFKKEWPEASTESFEAEEPESWVNDWYTSETVLVAEYWCKKPTKRKIALMPDGTVEEITDLEDEDLAQRMLQAAQSEMAMGREPREPMFRTVDSEKVVRYVVNGAEVLQGPEDWPGRYIPIIPVFGEEIWVADNLVRRGMVRTAKDPQRMLNYHNSAAVEAVALAPKAPFVGTDKQFEGHEHLWETANTDNHAYLPYKADQQAPGAPQRQPGPQVPAAMLALKQESVNDLNNATGIHPASLGQQSTETSGKAILARERQGDVGTFTFIDNLAIAIGYAGKQLVDLIPRIYDGQRIVRVLGEDDAEELMEVNALQPDGSVKNDLSRGKYDVIVQTGPSFSTKRQESAEAMLQFIQTAPESAGLVMDLIAKNMDWPGAEEIAERFRKQLIAQGVVEADPEKGEQPPPPPPPDPDMVKAETEAAKTQAGIAETEAKTEGQQLQNAEKALELLMESGQLQRIVEGYARQVLMGMGPPGPAQPNVVPMQPPQEGGF